jgi:hypothetical protein
MPTQQDAQNASDKATSREWVGLAVLALPCVLYAMDLTVLNLAIPSLTTDLKPTAAQLLWIVDVCRRGTERSSRNERITVTYSCAEDDGRPIGIGFQEQVPNQSELLRSKAVVVNVGSKVPDHRGRWASESRAKANPRRRVDNHTCRQNRRRSIPLGSVRRVPDDRADGDRRIGGGSWTQASTRNCGNQILDAKGEAQAAQTARREYRSQDLGRIDP